MELQVGVKVFLKNAAGTILLVRRSEEKYGKTRGSWDVPGGRIDAGSPLIENLRREVDEETKLPIISEPLLLAAQDILIGGEKHVVRISYVARTEGEPILDTTENVEFRWVSPADLLSFPDLDVFAAEIVQNKFPLIEAA